MSETELPANMVLSAVEVTEAAAQAGVTLYLTGARHFAH